MKNFDELADRFDSIPDLPITEEMLGAYIENNLIPLECCFIEEQINDNSILSNLYDFIVDSGIDNLDAFDPSFSMTSEDLDYEYGMDFLNGTENITISYPNVFPYPNVNENFDIVNAVSEPMELINYFDEELANDNLFENNSFDGDIFPDEGYSLDSDIEIDYDIEI